MPLGVCHLMIISMPLGVSYLIVGLVVVSLMGVISRPSVVMIVMWLIGLIVLLGLLVLWISVLEVIRSWRVVGVMVLDQGFMALLSISPSENEAEDKAQSHQPKKAHVKLCIKNILWEVQHIQFSNLSHCYLIVPNTLSTKFSRSAPCSRFAYPPNQPISLKACVNCDCRLVEFAYCVGFLSLIWVIGLAIKVLQMSITTSVFFIIQKRAVPGQYVAWLNIALQEIQSGLLVSQYLSTNKSTRELMRWLLKRRMLVGKVLGMIRTTKKSSFQEFVRIPLNNFYSQSEAVFSFTA